MLSDYFLESFNFLQHHALVLIHLHKLEAFN